MNDTTWFWQIVDARGLADVSSDEPVALKRLIGGHQGCWERTVPPGSEPYNPTDGACHVTHWRPLPEPPSAMLSAGCRRAVVSEDGRGVEAPSVTSAAEER